MKEKINQIAKGIFEYHVPEPMLQPERLLIETDAGGDYVGSFRVANRAGREMKGVVCTNMHFMEIIDSTFQGYDNEISFRFHAAHFLPGEEASGEIRILSDCGVVLLPFTVQVKAPACLASVGRVQNMDDFVSLARENIDEAARLFADAHFQNVVLGEDGQYLEVCRGLAKGKNPGMAMEEFLLETGSKTLIRLSADMTELDYEARCETFQDKLVLRKNTWGYCRYEVMTDADFICLEHSVIQTPDFVGDSYELEFVLHPERIRGMRGCGTIRIVGPWQTISIPVTLYKEEEDREARERDWRERQDILRLYDNFLRFRARQQSKKEYCNAVERLVCSMDRFSGEESEYGWIPRVFRVHLALLNHLEETVGLELAQMEEELSEIRERQPVFYCAYYYLNALWKQKDDVRQEAVSQIRECYQTKEDHWLVLWFLMQLDEKYQKAGERIEAMLEQFRHGCKSPLLYLEMCLLLNANPRCLPELDAITEQCLHWGCRRNLLNAELRFRYVYLMGRQKRFSPLFLEDLYQIYQGKPSDETLSVICQMLMRGRRASAEEWKWYELGIARNLKLTDLYESYICALENLCGGSALPGEEEAQPCVPEKVLYYFRYHNHLNEQRKSFLFAYIVCHKQADRESYDNYYPLMREYAAAQLEQGRIDRNLAVLYQEFFLRGECEPAVVRHLPEVMFRREIQCDSPGIVGVVVRHPELEREESVRFLKGKAVVSVYTSGAQIFLVDAEGNRYLHSIPYTVHPYLPAGELAGKCLEQSGDHEGLLLYLYEQAEKNDLAGDEAIELRKRVLGIRGLRDRRRKEVLASLVRFYFEHFEGELLDYQLHHLEWSEVDRSDRPLFIEYCAIRHCSDKGMEGIMEYGYDQFDGGCLLSLAGDSFRRVVESPVSQERPQLVKLAWNIFDKGSVNDTMLQYLCDSYSGVIPELLRIRRAARRQGIDVMDLAERILAQVIFTGEMHPEVYEVFYEYYDGGFNKKLMRAFLKMQAYLYLIRRQPLPDQIFDYFYKDVRVEENRPCLLAVLRHMGEKAQLTGEEAVFADYNIHQLCEKHVVLPFYQDFVGKVSVPDFVLKEQYIEYIADPASVVKVQYRIVSDGDRGEFVTENMTDVFEGIRVKGFVLFQDEVAEYRILETSPDGSEKVGDMMQARYQDRTSGLEKGSRYHLLNQMLWQEQTGQVRELTRQMMRYVEKEQTARQLLKPLQD